MWHDLLVATALVLVIEGIWPFLDPKGWRRALLEALAQDDRFLRSVGFISMATGVVLLYIVN